VGITDGMNKYSSREKELALQLFDEGNYVSDIGERLQIPRRTIYNWIQKRERGESLEYKKSPGRTPVKRLKGLPLVLQMLDAQKDLYLREIQAVLQTKHDLKVSLPTIMRWIDNSKYTLKKIVSS
jgi:transposase